MFPSAAYVAKDVKIPDATLGFVKNPSAPVQISRTFKFSNPHFGSSEYIALLRGLLPSHMATVVFSHGDLRAENVVVQPDQHGNYFLAGILD